jgi:hypothetical protein
VLFSGIPSSRMFSRERASIRFAKPVKGRLTLHSQKV